MVHAIDKKWTSRCSRGSGSSWAPGVGGRKWKRESAECSMERNGSDVDVGQHDGVVDNFQEDNYDEHFLNVPDWTQVGACYDKFYKVTSQHSIEMCMCAVCAHEVGKEFDGVRCCQLVDILNVKSLIPAVAHLEHCLLDGKLLEMSGVHTIMDSTKYVNICQTCFQELKRVGN